MNKQKIYEMISSDILTIEEQLGKREGSKMLWDNLKTKYEIVLPEISKVVKAEGKAVAIDREPDYRAELRKLKQALLTWIWMNEDDLTVNSSGIYNRAKTLINLGNVKSEEQELNNLISESEIYISKLSFREKE